jgi:hypothetical protein
MPDYIVCDTGKVCLDGVCDDSLFETSYKHSHSLSHSRSLLDVGDPIYKWVHECVGSKNTSRCKGSDNSYDTTGEECGCEVNTPIRYQWGTPSDRCSCAGTPSDDVPCFDTKNNNIEVQDSHCGCTKPSTQNPCEAPKECYEWKSRQETCTQCGGGQQSVQVECFNTGDQVPDWGNPSPDSKCGHLPKPPTQQVWISILRIYKYQNSNLNLNINLSIYFIKQTKKIKHNSTINI